MKPRNFVPSEVLEFRKKVGKNLKIIRNSLNLTQVEFATEYDLPKIQVSRLERGKSRYMDFVFIYKLSKKKRILEQLFEQDFSTNLYKFISSKVKKRKP